MSMEKDFAWLQEQGNIETLAEKLHEWYLEACQKINPESFNKEAQKLYIDLTEEQKFIDRYIAEKILKSNWEEDL